MDKSRINAVFEDAMSEEIALRKGDPAWSRDISSRVLDARRRRTRYRVTAGVSTLAAAAVLFIVIMAGIDQGTNDPGYTDMINSQTRGIYLSVFNTGTARGDYQASGTDTLLSADIDAIIDESLMMR